MRSSSLADIESQSNTLPLGQSIQRWKYDIIEIGNPALALRTVFNWQSSATPGAGTSARTVVGAGLHGGTTAFDGFTLTSSGSVAATGYLKVYGYN
jgi:hypothetical protein